MSEIERILYPKWFPVTSQARAGFYADKPVVGGVSDVAPTAVSRIAYHAL